MMEDTYTTTDLRMAFYLAAKGHPPAVDSVGENFCTFRFAKTPTLQEDVEAYQHGKALVSPQALDAARSRVRDLMRRAAGGAR
jgi:hypothetical protein